MTTESNILKDKFIKQFEIFAKESNQDNFLYHTRQQAIRQFDKLGFPTTKHEEWKYTNLSALQKQDFAFSQPSSLLQKDLDSLLFKDVDANVLVFMNGFFKPEFSKIISPENQIIIKNLKDALIQNADTIENYFGKMADLENDAFTALNVAFASEGVFVHIPANRIVEIPIIIHWINDTKEQNIASQIRNMFVIGENSQVNLIEKFDTVGDKSSFSNAFTEIFVHESAIVSHCKIQNENTKAYQINTTQVHQQRKSIYTNDTISLNGALIRNNLNLYLDGEFIEGNMNGLYMLTGDTLVDNHTIADHKQPNSVSNEYYKGIMAGNANGIFNGKIYVRPDAQKTNAYQQNRNVLLSDTASVNTKPQLEIWADDVKCSHGATTGSLDQTALFYLRSRGIPTQEAKALLIQAFANEIVEKIKFDFVRAYLLQQIEMRLMK